MAARAEPQGGQPGDFLRFSLQPAEARDLTPSPVADGSSRHTRGSLRDFQARCPLLAVRSPAASYRTHSPLTKCLNDAEACASTYRPRPGRQASKNASRSVGGVASSISPTCSIVAGLSRTRGSAFGFFVFSRACCATVRSGSENPLIAAMLRSYQPLIRKRAGLGRAPRGKFMISIFLQARSGTAARFRHHPNPRNVSTSLTRRNP